MAITRSDLNLIADNFRTARPEEGSSPEALAAWSNAVHAFADAAYTRMGFDRNGNRLFQTQRFLDRSGVEG